MNRVTGKAESRLPGAIFLALGACAVLTIGGRAQALTMQECSDKYKAAMAAHTLNGMFWNDFRRSQCTSKAPASPAAARPPAPLAVPASPPAPAPVESLAKPGTDSAPSSSAIFPSAVSSKYSRESPEKARMHTCIDQYKLNQITKSNGGLGWAMKGGGYYSECDKQLRR